MNWQTIKYFGKVKYFNISYVAILTIPIYIDFSSRINEAVGFELGHIPLSVRLIYLASLFYALGIAVYQYFCPKEIKEYVKVQEYIGDNYEILLNSYPDLKYEIVTANLDRNLQRKSLEKIESLNKSIHTESISESKKKELDLMIEMFLPSCVQNYLNNEFIRLLTKNKGWMITSFIFYIAGSLVLLGLLIKKSIVVLTF